MSNGAAIGKRIGDSHHGKESQRSRKGNFQSELKILEPSIEINGVGGVYFKNDHHSTPSDFMQQLKAI